MTWNSLLVCIPHAALGTCRLLLLQGKLRWVPLLPPVPIPEKGDAATPSSSGPASGPAATTKTRGKNKSVDGEQGGGVAEGKDGGQGDDEGFEFSWAGVEDLAKTYDLCATGPAFELALGAGDPEIGRYVAFCLKHRSVTPMLCRSKRRSRH